MFDPTRQIGKCRQWFFNDWRATFPVFAMCDNYVYRVAFKLSIFVIARGYDREWAVNASAVKLSGLDNRFFATFAILPSAKFPTHIILHIQSLSTLTWVNANKQTLLYKHK